VKHLLIILSFLLLSSHLFGQSQRPETIILPVSAMGEVSDTRKQILQNSLEENLKNYFMLISVDRFERAQEKAFEEMNYEECTEERCIILIQEMLQVENVFSLQVIVEGNDTQLSLSWRNLDEKKKATDVCRNCDSFELNNRITTLVDKLVSESPIKQESSLSIEEMRQKLKEEDERLAKEKQEREQKKRKEEERLIKEKEQRLAKIKAEEEKKGRKEKVVQLKEKKEKGIYFEKFYPNRKFTLIIAYTSSRIDFEPISDNSTWNVSEVDFGGFNIGFKYYFINNISIDGSFSQKSLSSTTFQNLEHIPSSQSGSFTDTNIGVNYHWYHDSLDLFTGGGITNYTYSSNFQDSSGINYELNSSKTGSHINLGFDYNYMNNFSINFEMLLIFVSDHEVSFTNNPNKHTTDGPTFFRIGMGYNL
jgi:hypothetical protein